MRTPVRYGWRRLMIMPPASLSGNSLHILGWTRKASPFFAAYIFNFGLRCFGLSESRMRDLTCCEFSAELTMAFEYSHQDAVRMPEIFALVVKLVGPFFAVEEVVA